MRYIAPIMLVLVLAACGGSSPAAVKVAASPSTSSSSSDASPTMDTGTVSGSLLTCNTVVDPGPPSVTAKKIISGLQVVLPDWGSISTGDPSTYDTTVLFTAEQDLVNYQGDQLASDAEQFAQDEQSYSGTAVGGNVGSIDPSYAPALESDIKTLAADCPP